MKTGDNIGFAVAGYLAVGAIIGLTQLGLNKLFEPPCSGIVKHALWERGHPEDTHFLWRAGSSVVQWLPDLYSRVLKGDMTVRDYLLGGYRCEPAVALKPQGKPLVSHGGLAGGVPRPEIPTLPNQPADTLGSGRPIFGGTRAPGSQAEALLEKAPPGAPAPAPAPASKPLGSWPRQPGEHSTTPPNSLLTDQVMRALLAAKQPSNSTDKAQPSPDSQFVTLEALPGVSLAVPRDWLVVGSEEIQQHVTAGEAVYGTGRGIPKSENTMAFRSPTETEGVGIAVASTPVTLTQQELRTASDAQIRELAAVIEQTARRGVEAQGLKLLPLADISREQVGGWLGLVFKARIVDASGTVLEQTQIHIPTHSRTIMLNLSYGKGAPPVFKPILAHARETLRIVEPGKP